MLGGRAHATVIHAKRTVPHLRDPNNLEMKEFVKVFIRQIISYSYEYSTSMKSDEWSHKKKVNIEAPQ